ncbi:hypothetical protein HGP14_27330 [Rhizobium sp. P32RR-XVIII]|uniref:hypothetical protein n=1 Tax=Rhizobium sp. P32RR-XVIII TaxID=2726738 RepID=UPI001456B4DC|nr:hypothetical protein [Rhizobium sp. P32RR-XVIII]NLS07015.1 hypothetical protein [Rhizobium sp. P32RR-XVIII]
MSEFATNRYSLLVAYKGRLDFSILNVSSDGKKIEAGGTVNRLTERNLRQAPSFFGTKVP